MENQDAEYWIKKGKDFYEANNYIEAIECCEKATRLDSNNTVAFYDWGKNIFELAKIKEDVAMFNSAFEKFDIAIQLDPNNAAAFYDWGNALSELAKIKQDVAMFNRAFEKYEKAKQLNPEKASIFNNWGAAIIDLIEIERDETLFESAFEKFDIATQLNPKDAFAFYNWGYAFLSLAESNKEAFASYESFRKNLEIFEIKSKDIDDTDTLLIKGELYFSLNQTEKTKECFIKSKKDILGILNSLDEKNRKEIIKGKILHSLLDSDDSDGAFFKETVKKLQSEQKGNLDAYKEVYIRSIFIISLLYVEFDEEEFVAQYRKKNTSQKLLFEKDSEFKLTAVNYSNDPSEGKTLLDFLYGRGNYSTDEELNSKYEAFSGSFSFDYDSLNQFRLYGKEDGIEGTGLSLVFRDNFFSKEAKRDFESTKKNSFDDSTNDGKSALFRCIYIDPNPGKPEQPILTVGQKEEHLFYREKIGDKFDSYNNKMKKTVECIRENMKELKDLAQKLDHNVVGQLLIMMRYLVKHISFKDEQECRIVKIRNLSDVEIKNDFSRLYIKYQHKVSNHIDKIIFGPKAKDFELFKSMLKNKKLEIECEKSKNLLA